MEFIECEWYEDDVDEQTHPIFMTHNEVMFIDDSLTMMIAKDIEQESVTTMRSMLPSAILPAPVDLLDKMGIAVLRVTDPECVDRGTIVYFNESELYMLREICHSYCKVGNEYVGYNLKRKIYQVLYSDTYKTDKTVSNLLATVDLLDSKKDYLINYFKIKSLEGSLLKSFENYLPTIN